MIERIGIEIAGMIIIEAETGMMIPRSKDLCPSLSVLYIRAKLQKLWTLGSLCRLKTRRLATERKDWCMLARLSKAASDWRRPWSLAMMLMMRFMLS
jgi:hypothetical protein